ncbi:hypothetical protein L3V59_18660 [Burkholderia aenigmatica]|uniref:hypothetical protein n=1 Tax=Burkholderia aenigmatica TaxID=2015348 RepID=UPI001F1BF552|nr:hypothetical protein [Burkholderia aenigmatica]UKD14986.1 hypothetical protein L3V59_18660 [Burkholderia aenigmatica]
MQALPMDQRDEKRAWVTEIMTFIETQPYDPDICARYVYTAALDARAHRYRDRRLDTLLDTIRGMSAGDEFHYSQDELVEMLQAYLRDAE